MDAPDERRAPAREQRDHVDRPQRAFAVERRGHHGADVPTQPDIVERPAAGHVPLEREAGIVVPGGSPRPRIQALHQPRDGAEPPLQMRADLLRGPIPRDHEHLACMSANRAGLEREDARIIGAQQLARHRFHIAVVDRLRASASIHDLLAVVGMPAADHFRLTFR